MHLTTPSNALSNFSLPGLPGRNSFVRHDFMEWDESAADEAHLDLLTINGRSTSGDLAEARSRS